VARHHWNDFAIGVLRLRLACSGVVICGSPLWVRQYALAARRYTRRSPTGEKRVGGVNGTRRRLCPSTCSSIRQGPISDVFCGERFCSLLTLDDFRLNLREGFSFESCVPEPCSPSRPSALRASLAMLASLDRSAQAFGYPWSLLRKDGPKADFA